ncbi:hypothetical protein C8R43DRAFT_96126 [Mycena crocata]|nr:hypothetical protein C8R43DRAFT_96126 [Mycena crocata]
MSDVEPRVNMTAAELRARLTEIDAGIHRKMQERVAVQSQLDATVYPVLTLPIEIVSEIFIHCIPPGDAKVLLAEAPWVLLKVCRAWREIALSTPRLWNTLNIQAATFARRVYWWPSLAVDWLSRARSNPLSLTLRHPPIEDETDTVFQPDYAFLRQIASRLECLTVLGMEQEVEINMPDSNLDYTPGSFPLLKRLVFGPWDPESSIYDCWFAFFLDAPQLRELVILAEVRVSRVLLPWHQLTKFTGSNFELEECLEVLRLAPELEECTFAVQFGCDAPSSCSLTHLRLQSLTLLPDREGDCWGYILQYLTLPSLNSLQISPSDFSGEFFEKFLSRSSAPLRRVSITPDRWFNFDEWEKCFRLMSDLEELHLGCLEVEFQTDFMKAFGTSEDKLLPRLRHLLVHRPTPRYNEVSNALTERKNRHGADELSYVLLHWPTGTNIRPGLSVRFL